MQLEKQQLCPQAQATLSIPGSPGSPILWGLVSLPINNADSWTFTWLPAFSEYAPPLRRRVKFISASFTPHHHGEMLKWEQWYLPSWSGVRRARAHDSTYTAHRREDGGTPRNKGKAPWVYPYPEETINLDCYVYTFSFVGLLLNKGMNLSSDCPEVVDNVTYVAKRWSPPLLWALIWLYGQRSV